jgi:hypothetical protein
MYQAEIEKVASNKFDASDRESGWLITIGTIDLNCGSDSASSIRSDAGNAKAAWPLVERPLSQFARHRTHKSTHERSSPLRAPVAQ